MVDFRSDVKDFDKGSLKDELKNAGLEDFIADEIVDRVDNRKVDGWSQDMGRQEALREIEMFIDRANQAYDNYRQRNSTRNTVSSTTY